MSTEEVKDEAVKVDELVAIPMVDETKFIGKVVVLYRNEVNTPAGCIGVDKKAKRIMYEILAGPDKGKKYSGKFDETQKAIPYDEEHEVLAFMKTAQ